MASALEREILRLKDTTVDMLCQGAALDYTAYASLVARLRVLNDLVEFIRERNKAIMAGTIGDLDETDDDI